MRVREFMQLSLSLSQCLAPVVAGGYKKKTKKKKTEQKENTTHNRTVRRGNDKMRSEKPLRKVS